jgi:hypothetical protein
MELVGVPRAPASLPVLWTGDSMLLVLATPGALPPVAKAAAPSPDLTEDNKRG